MPARMVGRPLNAAPLLLAFGEMERTADGIAGVAIVATCKFYMLKVHTSPSHWHVGIMRVIGNVVPSHFISLFSLGGLRDRGSTKDRKAGLFVSSEYLVAGIYYKGCLTHSVLTIIKLNSLTPPNTRALTSRCTLNTLGLSLHFA